MAKNSLKLSSDEEQFLRGKSRVDVTDVTLAVELEDKIRQVTQHSFADALKLSRRFVKAVERRDDPYVLMRHAYRALARTLHLSGECEKSIESYLKARQLARKDKDFKARIDRALIDVYMYLGDFTEARRRARMAENAFRELKSDVDVAMTQVNYGNLLHRWDRHREAEQMYHRAGECFLRHKNKFAAARAAFNRANSLLQLFEIDEAKSLYEESQAIYQELGLSRDAAESRYGLAWLYMLIGEYDVALRELTQCEVEFAQMDHPRGVALCTLDRAEVYLQLNLWQEARETALEAEKRFRKLRLHIESAKAMFFRGSAAAAMGARREAEDAARKALAKFKSNKNAGFSGASLILQSEVTQSESAKRNKLHVARQLFNKAQLPLWEAIADLHVAQLNGDNGKAFDRLSKNKATTVSPHLFAHWQTALGDRAMANGKPDRARMHWRSAADRLDALRISLPPVELRRSVTRHASSPHGRLINAEMKNNTLEAAVWLDRYHTAGLWAPANNAGNESERRKIKANLDDLARRFASLSHSLYHGSTERSISDGSMDPPVETAIRRCMEVQRKSSPAKALQTNENKKIADCFKSVSRRMPVIQFHFNGPDLYALIHENGRSRSRVFNDGRQMIERFMKQLRFFLDREMYFPMSKTDNSTEKLFFESFGEWIWRPLEIESSATKALICPEGQTANIPWEALRVAGEPIGDTIQFVQSPSIRHFLQSGKSKTKDDSVHIFLGESEGIGMVRQEAEALADLIPGAKTQRFKSLRSDWPHRGSARLMHFAGHGYLRSDNPYYSYLAMQDGPIFAADFRHHTVTANLVTLSACRSVEDSAASGEESTGLPRALLEMGARNVLGARWPVSDSSSEMWMREFYGKLFDENTLAESMRFAMQKVREARPSAFHWAGYAVYGAGDLPQASDIS